MTIPSRRALALALALLPALLVAGCSNLTRVSEVHRPEGSTDTRDRPIDAAPRQTVTFPEEGVVLSDDFAGGRMGRPRRLGEGVYELTISPENEPINDSAWYALRARAEPPRQVRLVLGYAGGTHRYHPKISRNGESWRPLAEDRVSHDPATDRVTLRLDLDGTPTWIAAQELVTSATVDRWAAGLARLPFVARTSVGRTTGDRQLTRLDIGQAPADAPVVVILGRQHPPEVTGTLALMAFVETLCSEEAVAVSFRRRFRTVVLPLLNPDGVDLGHWRHNAKGVDLNRDWRDFHQAETRLVRDGLLAMESGPVVFAIDFHSTFEDLFYVSEDGQARETEWIEAIARALPEYRFKIRPVAAEATVATNWLAEALATPAVTYEVGDTTERARLRDIAAAAARALMDLLDR